MKRNKKSSRVSNKKSSQVVKTVFILGSIAVLTFLVLVVKSFNFGSSPRAGLNSKYQFINKKYVNKTNVGFPKKPVADAKPEDIAKIKELCAGKAWTDNGSRGTVIKSDRFEVRGIAYSCPTSYTSVATVFYSSKNVVDNYKCCLTKPEINIYNDNYCSNLYVYNTVSQGTPTPAPYKANLRCKKENTSDYCNSYSPTDSSNVYRKLMYVKDSKNTNTMPSKCNFYDTTVKLNGNCCGVK